jgi:uncharacterized protein (DUF4415 family)
MNEKRKDSRPVGPRSWEEARRMAREDIERTTPEENDSVHAGALTDPDNPPLTERELAQFRRVADVRPELIRRFRGQRGPQKSKPVKTRVSLRLDPGVIAFFRKKGAGWQSSINDALRKVAKLPARAKAKR